MAIAKLLIDAGKGAVLEKIVGKFSHIYDKFRHGEREYSSKIDEYRVNGGNYFRSGPVGEVANRYGLENLLDGYKKSAFDKIKAYLAELKGLADYLMNSPAAPASSHSIYVRVSRAYESMLKLLGYSPSEDIKKAATYASDFANNYMHKIGDLNARLGKFLSLASGINADGSSLIGAASRRAAKHIAYKVLESKGIPIDSLGKALPATVKPFAELGNKAKALFAEYSDLVQNRISAYSDIGSGVYARA